MTLSAALGNIYFIITALSLLMFIALMVVVAVSARPSPTIRWLQTFMAGATLSSVNAIGLYFTQNQSTYERVNNLIPLYVVILGISFIYFSFNYIGRSAWQRKAILWIPLWSTAVLLLYFGWTTDLIISYHFAEAELKPWGFVNLEAAPYEILTNLWIVLCFLVAITAILWHYLRLQPGEQKKQTLIIILGLALPFVIAIINVGILPLVNIHIMPVFMITNLVMALTLSYALLKYGATTLDPAAILDNIVQTMENAAIGLNEELRVIFVNKATSVLLGYKDKDLLGKSIERLVPPDILEALQKHRSRKSAAPTDSYTFQTTVTHQNGSKMAVNLSISMYYEKNGVWRGAVLILSDIQRLQSLLERSDKLASQLENEKKNVEQKVIERTEQLKSEQARLKASVNSLQQGFIMMDTDNKVLLTNQAFRDMFPKLSSENFSLKQFSEALGGQADLEEGLEYIRKWRSSRRFENVRVRNLYVNIFVSPVVNEDRIIGCVVLIDDVTENRILERSKDEFFSIASHELRTPLTSIKGNSSMLLDYYADEHTDPQMREMLQDIRISSDRLIELVNDFLDMSRLEQGKIKFTYQKIDLRAAIRLVATELRPLVAEKNIALNYESTVQDNLPPVEADPERLKQVLINLVGNAIKFTDQGSVTVSAAPDVQTGFIRVTVADTGRGISPAAQKLLFHKFQQAGESLLTRDTTRGTGLGLYISKTIIDTMGGAIGLESSDPDKGSVFWFTLPLQRSKTTPGTTEASKVVTDTSTGISVAAERQGASDN